MTVSKEILFFGDIFPSFFLLVLLFIRAVFINKYWLASPCGLFLYLANLIQINMKGKAVWIINQRRKIIQKPESNKGISNVFLILNGKFPEWSRLYKCKPENNKYPVKWLINSECLNNKKSVCCEKPLASQNNSLLTLLPLMRCFFYHVTPNI